MLVDSPSNKFAYVVGASDNYIEGLIALFNSMEYHGSQADVILIPWKLPEEFIQGLDKYSFNFRVIPNNIEHQVLATAIERFNVAAEYGKGYDAICLLDADMYLLGDVDLFFEVAAAGFIITGSNGMIIDFNAEYQKHYQTDLGRPRWPYKKIHTSAPVFVSPKDLDWFRLLYDSRRIDTWDDFLFFNMLGIKLEKYKRMICMPPYAFTGIHHWQVKVETGVLKKGQDVDGDDLILAGTEEAVYMAHGKFWDETYCKDLLTVMYGYLERWSMTGKSKQRMEDAQKVLVERFWKYRNYEIQPKQLPVETPKQKFGHSSSSSSGTSIKQSSNLPPEESPVSASNIPSP